MAIRKNFKTQPPAARAPVIVGDADANLNRPATGGAYNPMAYIDGREYWKAPPFWGFNNERERGAWAARNQFPKSGAPRPDFSPRPGGPALPGAGPNIGMYGMFQPRGPLPGDNGPILPQRAMPGQMSVPQPPVPNPPPVAAPSALRSGLNLGSRSPQPDRAQPMGGVAGAMAAQGAMLGGPAAAAPPVVNRGNIANDPRGLDAYQYEMNRNGSRTGGLGMPQFGYGVGPDGQGWRAKDIVAGAGLPQQAVDGQYAVNPTGKYAMGGQYYQPGSMMAPVQGWRQGVAPSAADMAINDAYQGKKEQYVNTRFSNPQVAYERMAQARARRMGIPIAGLDAAGVRQAIAQGQDMRALRARGVNTNDPRVMRQLAQRGGPQVGNQYAAQRFNNIMSSENPDIKQAIEAAVESGLPPAQIRERIGGTFGMSAFDAAMQGYSNYGGGFFGGEDANKKRIHNYMNPAPSGPPTPYIPTPQLPPSITPAVPPVNYNPQGRPGPWRSGYVFPPSPRQPMPMGIGRY